MLKRWLSFGAVTAAMAVGLVGCGGGFGGPKREAWRGEAELACLRSGAIEGMPFIKESREINGPGSCGADFPLKVAGFSNEFTASIGGQNKQLNTALKPVGTFACPMVPTLKKWLDEVAQPAAMEWFGQPIVEIRSMGSYACRSRNNRRGAKLSEHSFANAIDIGSFKMADGTVVSVRSGWRGDLPSQGFLRSSLKQSCRYFRTVLGPGAAFHADHFHFDLARHNRKGASYCRPRDIAVPAKPDGFMPGMAASYADESGQGMYEKPAPGPKPLQDDGYEQEPDLSDLDVQR
jgi:hypothetical protein